MYEINSIIFSVQVFNSLSLLECNCNVLILRLENFLIETGEDRDSQSLRKALGLHLDLGGGNLWEHS